MKIYLLRHGRTIWNGQHRYQGFTDVPLSPEGEAELIPAEFTPETVYVSPLSRARRTAELVFPQASQHCVENLREMHFGVFEGRTYLEMEQDRDYRAWVDGNCEGKCPGGESFGEFSQRVCGAFEALVNEALAQHRQQLVILAHGGVQMAVLEAFGLPERQRFAWQSPCGGGFLLETDETLWRQRRKLRLLETVQYTKGEETC